MKSPPVQYADDIARDMVEAFIRGDNQNHGVRKVVPTSLESVATEEESN